jgi:hypothetical protein
METLLDNGKLKQKFPLEGDYFSLECSHCGGISYVSEPMKDCILTCSFCGEKIIKFKLKTAVKKEAEIKKVLSEMINLKLLSSVKDLLTSDKFEDEPSTSFCTYQGKWDTKYGSIVLEEIGDRVEGSYSLNDGRIRGTVKDNTLLGKWSQKPSYSEPNDAGDVEFRLSDDGKSFKGRWRYGSSDDWKFDWCGKLIAR